MQIEFILGLIFFVQLIFLILYLLDKRKNLNSELLQSQISELRNELDNGLALARKESRENLQSQFQLVFTSLRNHA